MPGNDFVERSPGGPPLSPKCRPKRSTSKKGTPRRKRPMWSSPHCAPSICWLCQLELAPAGRFEVAPPGEGWSCRAY